MRWMLVALAVFLQTSQYPPGYPRPGATKLFENDRVVVWDIGWLKQEYPVHRHVYALAGVYYTSGDHGCECRGKHSSLFPSGTAAPGFCSRDQLGLDRRLAARRPEGHD